MNLVNAVVLNDKQIALQKLNLSTQDLKSEILDIQSLEDNFFHLLLGENEALDHVPSLANNLTNTVFLSTEQLDTTLEELQKMPFEKLEAITTKTLRNWNLANNLSMIENFSAQINHIKDMWIKDRDHFFEELWFLLKQVLICSDVKIIFRDLKPEKEELRYTCLSGTTRAEFSSGDSFELLMNEYKAEFDSPFKITEYNREQFQLVACAKIDQSPILIMMNIREIGPLQQSILKGIFNGLQS